MCISWTRKYLCGCIWDEDTLCCLKDELCCPRMIMLYANGLTCKDCWRRGDTRVNPLYADIPSRPEPTPSSQRSILTWKEKAKIGKGLKIVIPPRTSNKPSEVTGQDVEGAGQYEHGHGRGCQCEQLLAPGKPLGSVEGRNSRSGPCDQRDTASLRQGRCPADDGAIRCQRQQRLRCESAIECDHEPGLHQPADESTLSHDRPHHRFHCRHPVDGGRRARVGDHKLCIECGRKDSSISGTANSEACHEALGCEKKDSISRPLRPLVSGGDLAHGLLEGRPETPRVDWTVDPEHVPDSWLESNYNCDVAKRSKPVPLSSIRRDYRARRGRTDWYLLEGECHGFQVHLRVGDMWLTRMILDILGEYLGPDDEESEEKKDCKRKGRGYEYENPWGFHDELFWSSLELNDYLC